MKKEYQQYWPHLILLGVVVVLRLASAHTWRIDSDEPQHLHVIWGWANGLLQYRDVFDNHAPLFHLMMAPVYALFGERADILVLMRLSLIPLFLVSLWAVYLLGKALYSKEVGFWATTLTAFYPKFFLTSLEFRADDLWIVPWLFALVLVVRQPWNTARLMFIGILLGATTAISMKTTLLLASLGFAVIAASTMEPSKHLRSRQEYLARGAVLIAGFALVPLLCVMFFAAKGALGAMYYGVIQHNIVPGLGHWNHFNKIYKTVLSLIPLVVIGVWLIRASCREPDLRWRRIVIFLAGSLALIGLYAFWPLITRQDFLPIIPLFIISGTGLLVERLSTVKAYFSFNSKAVVLSLMAATEIGLLTAKNFHSQTINLHETRLLTEALELTRPGEEILDLKGETVFRPRPYYYALEGVTRRRIQLGLIKDSIPEDIIRTGTTVAASDSLFFPGRGREFLNENFVAVGSLRVAGRLLDGSQRDASGNIVFEVAVPAQYQVISEYGKARGLLDGNSCDQPRLLAPGRHTFRPSDSGSGHWAVIWAPAVERGFSPFSQRRV